MAVQLSQLKELIPFLEDSRPELRLTAMQVLAGFTNEQAHRNFLLTLNIAKYVVPLLDDVDTNVTKYALSCCINLCGDDQHVAAIIKNGAVDVLMRALRSKVDKNLPLRVMLVANLSRDVDGAKAIMQWDTKLQGLHLIRLIQWFIAPVPPTDTDDSYQYVANILTNISQIAPGRQMLVDKDRGILRRLAPFIMSKSTVRALGVLRMFRNCCLDPQCQAAVLDPDNNVLPFLFGPLIGGNTVTEEEKKTMLPLIAQQFKAGKRPTPHLTVRKLIVEALLACVREDKSRRYLRSINTYVVLREYHKWEEKHGDAELDKMLHDIQPYFILDEDDEVKAINPKDYKITHEWQLDDTNKKGIPLLKGTDSATNAPSSSATASANADEEKKDAGANAGKADDKAAAKGAGDDEDDLPPLVPEDDDELD